ncbi:MAG: glycosyltransferase family 39 protein [Chloroflexota bacterium]
MFYAVIIWLIYLGLSVLITWPIAGQLGSAVPGSEGDVWVHLWTFRWVRDRILAGEGFLYTDLMFSPDGVSLATHNFAWFHIALWIPLQALVGESAAYSIIFIFGFSFTAFATYLLAFHLFKHRAAAFVAGLIAGFWPYTLSHHNHPNLIFIGFVPLSLYFISRYFETPTIKNSLLIGLSIGMIAVVRWQMLVYALPLLFVFTLYMALTTFNEINETYPSYLEHLKHNILPALAIPIFFILFALSPILLNFSSSDLSTSAVSAGETVSGSTDLAAYVIPSRYHPLWGEAVKPLTTNFVVNHIFTPYIGLGTFFLALCGLIFAPRRKGKWVWLGLVIGYIAVALGPEMRIYGQKTMELMPYDLIDDTLLDAIIRRPDRLNIIISIPVALLSGLGFTYLFGGLLQDRQPSFSIKSLVLPSLIIGIILFEYVVHYPMFPTVSPAWYAELAQEEGDFAILELPMHSRAFDEYYMQYQSVHGKQLVGGHVSRLPADAGDFIRSISFLGNTISIEPRQSDIEIVKDFETLRQAGVRYIVLHKNFLSDDHFDQWQAILVTNPVYEDEQVAVFSTQTDLIVWLEQELNKYFKGPIVLANYEVEVPAPTQEGVIDVEATWFSLQDLTTQVEVCLELFVNPLTVIHESCETIHNSVDVWPGSIVRPMRHTLDIPRYINPANYQLGLTINPDETFRDLGPVAINVVPRTFDQPATIDNDADLIWGDWGEIKLLGYDYYRDSLTLYWKALDRTEQYFIRFIHIVDPQTGLLVAQIDTAPRDYGYPTTWWEKGEIIEEAVELPLDDLPTGDYDIYLGLYDRETGQRAPVTGDISVSEQEAGAARILKITK